MNATTNLGSEQECVIKRIEHVDTDASGVVHFSRYASLLETAIMEQFYDIGCGLQEFNKKNLDFRIYNLSVRYISAIYFMDHIQIYSTIQHVGMTNFRVKGEIYKKDRLEEPVATGIIDFAVVDIVTNKPALIPLDLKTIMEGRIQK